jgi:hypothetical protein
MERLIFYPKPHIKLLITQEESINFQPIFTAKRVSNNRYRFRCIECERTDLTANPIEEIIKTQCKEGSMYYKYFNYDTEIFSCAAWTESLESIIRKHDFYKPMLYFYIIS